MNVRLEPEILYTLVLTVINIVGSLLVLGAEFHWRFKHLGQELTFLALGLVGYHVTTARSRSDYQALICALLLYLLAWLAVFYFSARLMQDRTTWRNPFVYFSLAAGIVATYTALTNSVYGWVGQHIVATVTAK